MADIGESLRRLQTSIAGLSDASNVVAAIDANPSPTGSKREHNLNGSYNTSRQSRMSPVHPQSSSSNSITGSLEAQTLAELRELRVERESLQLLRQQVAAVHRLRLDLARKDALIHELQLKLQELSAGQERALQLEDHCRMLEERCDCLENCNHELGERESAAALEQRERVEALTQQVMDLQDRCQAAEAAVRAEKDRHRAKEERASVDTQRMRDQLTGLRAASEEATRVVQQAREEAQELRAALEQERSQGKRGGEAHAKALAAEAERLEAQRQEAQALSDQVSRMQEELRAEGSALRQCRGAHQGLTAALQRATSALAEHLEETRGSRTPITHEAVLRLSQAWSGSEALMPLWLEVSKMLQSLEELRVSEKAVVWTLENEARQHKQRAERVQQELADKGAAHAAVEERLRADAQDLRAAADQAKAEASELRACVHRLEAGALSREREGEALRKDASAGISLADAVWRELYWLGLVPGAAPSSSSERSAPPSLQACDVPWEAKTQQVTTGLQQLVRAWQRSGQEVACLSDKLAECEAQRERDAEALRAQQAQQADGLAQMLMEQEQRLEQAREEQQRAAEAKLGQALGEQEAELAGLRQEAQQCREEARLCQEQVKAARALSADAVQCLRLLARFVLPLQRLCRELRQQKAFLADHYRSHAPVQEELFKMASQLSGAAPAGSPPAWVHSAAPGGGNQDREEQPAKSPASPSKLPPSFRAVVISVMAANRLERLAASAKALRGIEPDGPPPGGPTTSQWSGAPRHPSLPMLPAHMVCAEPRLPGARDLHAMAPQKALDAVLAGVLGHVSSSSHADDSARGLGNIPVGRWGGSAETSGGDLLHRLLLGRRRHMSRIKERGLLVDPLATASPPNRVRLGRLVREQFERGLWLGDGPGRSGVAQLRIIRGAVSTLARELNQAEQRALELACLKIPQQEELREREQQLELARARVAQLERQATEAITLKEARLLEDDRAQAWQLTEQLKAELGDLESRLSDSEQQLRHIRDMERQAVQELERECASNLALNEEVEHLRSFAARAYRDREECMERERERERDRSMQHSPQPQAEPPGEAGGLQREVVEALQEAVRGKQEELDRCEKRCSTLEASLQALRSGQADLLRQREGDQRALQAMKQEARRCQQEARHSREQAEQARQEAAAALEAERARLEAEQRQHLHTEAARLQHRRDLLDEQHRAQNELQEALNSFLDGRGSVVRDEGTSLAQLPPVPRAPGTPANSDLLLRLSLAAH